MIEWTKEDLLRLDKEFAEKNIHPHQRAFHAAHALLGDEFSFGSMEDTTTKKIMQAYSELFPRAHENWPGMGKGLVASIDDVRNFTVPVIFGSGRIEPWKVLGFNTQADWWAWCRQNHDIASHSAFSVADLMDFNYGVDEAIMAHPASRDLWEVAGSNLADVANLMPNTFSVESIIQPIFLTCELSIKAALVCNGANANDFAKKGSEGHDLKRLSLRLSKEFPHGDDAQLADITSRMPEYVASRYAPAKLTRLHVVQLAIGAQFVAASTARRVSSRDLQADFAASGPRPRMFT